MFSSTNPFRPAGPCRRACIVRGGQAAPPTSPKASKKGAPRPWKSAGPLAFGPEGILFIGDPQGAAVFALDTGDRTAAKAADRPKVEAIDEKIASMVGIESKQLLLNDVAVNPISGNVYLAASRGKGADAAPLLFRVDRAGKIEEVGLKDVGFSKAALPNAAEGKKRQDAITHLAFVKGRVYIAGLSNEEFASNLRSIPFPFDAADKGASVEIFHGSHGQIETKSPVRTFVEYGVEARADPAGGLHLHAAGENPRFRS